MYAPAVDTLIAGARSVADATSWVVESVDLHSGRKADAELNRGDIFVWVGNCGAQLAPWAALALREVRTVYFQTEPMVMQIAPQELVGQDWMGAVQEIWTYAASHIPLLHRFLGLNQTVRWLPPGAVPAPSSPTNVSNSPADSDVRRPISAILASEEHDRRLSCGPFCRSNNSTWSIKCRWRLTCAACSECDRGLPSRDVPPLATLFFVGSTLAIFPERRRCVNWLEAHRTHVEVISHTWEEGDPLLHGLVENSAIFLNIHKRCNTSEFELPAEAFRLAQLLNLGAVVLSERSAMSDEMAYAGLLDFVPFGEIPAAAARLSSMDSRDFIHLGRERAMAFARRFEPGALFRRAGVDQLMHRQYKLNPRNRPLTSTWISAI